MYSTLRLSIDIRGILSSFLYSTTAALFRFVRNHINFIPKFLFSCLARCKCVIFVVSLFPQSLFFKMRFFIPLFWLCEGLPDPLAEDILSPFLENSTRSGYWFGISCAQHFLRHQGLCIRWFNFVSFCTSLQITDQKYSFSRFQLPRTALESNVELYNVVEFISIWCGLLCPAYV